MLHQNIIDINVYFYFNFLVQFSKNKLLLFCSNGGSKWTRTIDLTLIRRAL